MNFQKAKSMMDTGDWITLAALALSLVSLAITLYERLRSEQEAIIKALQGEKENVAFTALKVRNRQWPNSPFSSGYKDEVIASLCLAWVMEGSDRARALVLSALKQLNADTSNRKKIKKVLEVIESQFTDYVNSAYADNKEEGQEKIDNGLKKAQQLRTALGIEQTSSNVRHTPNR
jgi:hypothetical protein